MVSAVDSFIEYLNLELAGDPPVNWVRHTPYDESASVFQRNALNVMALGAMQRGSMEEILVTLDIVADDSRKAYTWADTLRDILVQRQFAPELSYTNNPTSPMPLQKLISWDPDEISFRLIAARPWRKQEATGTEGSDAHLNCTFTITHSRM